GFVLYGAHGGDAGADGVAIDDHGAGTALSQTAAELRAIQLEIIAQGVKQRHIGLGLDCLSATIYLERNLRHGSPFCESRQVPAMRTVVGFIKYRQSAKSMVGA